MVYTTKNNYSTLKIKNKKGNSVVRYSMDEMDEP